MKCNLVFLDFPLAFYSLKKSRVLRRTKNSLKSVGVKKKWLHFFFALTRHVDGQMKELAKTFTVKCRVGALSVRMTWYSCHFLLLPPTTTNLYHLLQLSLFAELFRVGQRLTHWNSKKMNNEPETDQAFLPLRRFQFQRFRFWTFWF